MNRNNPGKALEVLQTVSPYELGLADTLYSAYLRGLAYLLLRQGNEATTEFQKILDHRSIVLNNSQGALARVGLARAYTLQGDTTKARYGDEQREGYRREAATHFESSYATCRRHAQFHVMTDPPANVARYPSSAWEKVSTASLGS